MMMMMIVIMTTSILLRCRPELADPEIPITGVKFKPGIFIYFLYYIFYRHTHTSDKACVKINIILV
jgi:hypothetical protein